MSELSIIFLFCFFSLTILCLALYGAFALLRDLSRRGTPPTALPNTLPTDGLTPSQLRARLSAIRASAAPLAALDAWIDSLPRPLPEPRPTAQGAVGAATSGATPSVDVAQRLAPPERQLPGWLQLDGITLLLYLGATLVVIAAAVFVISAWEALPPLARWALVVLLALAFLGVGELFVRWRSVLRRAGETYRNVGLLLLPFVALAFDRFVLAGQGTPRFWLLISLLLTIFYYVYYRFSSADWIASGLASLSAGLVVFNLLSTFDPTEEAWFIPAFFAVGWALLSVAHRVWHLRADDGRTLRDSPLVVTHLVNGSLFLLFALVIAMALLSEAIASEALIPHAPFMLLALLSTAFFVWLTLIGEIGLPLAGVVLSLAALLTLSPIGWSADKAFALPSNVVGWNGLAALSMLAVPFVKGWRQQSQATLIGAALLLSGTAWSAISVELGAGWLTVSSVALSAILLSVTLFYRNALWPIAAIAVGHVAFLALIDWLDPPGEGALLLGLVWTAAAALWLFLRWYQGTAPWLRTAMNVAFIAESAWAALWVVQDHPAMLVVAALLAALWVAWTFVVKEGVGLVAFALFLFYALFALGRLVPLPPPIPALFVGAVGVGLASVAPWLPFYLRRSARGVGLALTALAPLAAFMVKEPLILAGLDARWGSAIALLLGGAAHTTLGATRRDDIGFAGGLALLYGGFAFALLAWDVTAVQWYSAPLALLFLSYSWLFKQQRPLHELFALVALLLPAVAQTTSDRFLYTAILAGWGLLLLTLGITQQRRLLSIGGSVALILAALRQLWAIISVLPPGFAIGLVGLLLMVLAVVLTLQRDALLRVLRGGGRNGA